jgi:PAS domain S-box-containing protein
MNIQDMVPKDKQAEHIELHGRLSKGEIVPPFEAKRLTRDGRTINVWMVLTTLFNDAKQPRGIATTEREISKQI